MSQLKSHGAIVGSRAAIEVDVKQSAVGAAITRIHDLFDKIRHSAELTESALSPALRPQNPVSVADPDIYIESELHRELLAIEDKAKSVLRHIDSWRERSTI